jgi:hypothetical protein
MEGSKILFDDRRFARHYKVAHSIQVNADAAWCIFKRKD